MMITTWVFLGADRFIMTDLKAKLDCFEIFEADWDLFFLLET